LLVRAVIDALRYLALPQSGRRQRRPAIGEKRRRRFIRYGIPDAFGGERSRYAGRKVLVIGSGHSAMDTGHRARAAQVRSAADHGPVGDAVGATAKTFGGLTDDKLASRGALGQRAKAAVDRGRDDRAPFRVAAFSLAGGGIAVSGETAEGMATIAVDEVIVATGFRPDYSALSEIPARPAPLAGMPAHGSAADRSQRTQLRQRFRRTELENWNSRSGISSQGCRSSRISLRAE